MRVERKEYKATVREGYQILLRAEAELLLPTEKPKMCDFYTKLAKACILWAAEVHGDTLRKEFAALESTRERSRFRTQQYRFRMRVAWEDASFASILCESELTGQWKEPQNSYHRTSHVWNLEEETILPVPQILQTFGVTLSKEMFPFRPDGIYPDGEGIVLFRNPTSSSHFMEKKLTLTAQKREKKVRVE